MQNDHVDEILSQWNRERPDLDVAPMGVFGRVARLARYLNGALTSTFRTFGLSSAEFDVLAVLRRSGRPYQLTPTDLYSALMLSSGAMTNRIDRLEQAGLVARTDDPTDRRGVLVGLTPEGLALIEQAVEAHVVNEHQLLDVLSEEEQAMLANLLRTLLGSFEARAVPMSNRLSSPDETVINKRS